MDKSQKELIKTLRNEFLKRFQFNPTHLLLNLPFLRGMYENIIVFSPSHSYDICN